MSSEIRIINPVVYIEDGTGIYGVGLDKALQLVIDSSGRRRVEDDSEGFKMAFVDLDYAGADEQRQVGAMLNSQPDRIQALIEGLQTQLQVASDEDHAKAWAKQIAFYQSNDKYRLAGVTCLPFRRWTSRDEDRPAAQAGAFFAAGIADFNEGRGIRIYGKEGVSMPEPDTMVWQMVVLFLDNNGDEPKFGLAVAVPDPEMINEAIASLKIQLRAAEAFRDQKEEGDPNPLGNGNGAELGRIKAELRLLLKKGHKA